jgi:hypothetical protein
MGEAQLHVVFGTGQAADVANPEVADAAKGWRTLPSI